jgi:hypothetical protein
MKANLSEINSHGYYNKTIHECILKLHLPIELLNKIYTHLHKKNEVAPSIKQFPLFTSSSSGIVTIILSFLF